MGHWPLQLLVPKLSGRLNACFERGRSEISIPRKILVKGWDPRMKLPCRSGTRTRYSRLALPKLRTPPQATTL